MRCEAILRSALRAACLGLLLAVGSAGAGCGDDASSSGDDGFETAAKGISECLSQQGARQATDVADIALFVDDSESGETVQPASAGNGLVEIEEYRPVRTVVGHGGGVPDPDYVVWVVQPYGEPDLEPGDALETDEGDALVMYVEEPDREQTRMARRCLHDLGTDLPASISG